MEQRSHRKADEPSGKNSVRGAYVHKAEYLEKRVEMMQWWADYLDANGDGYISAYQYARRLKKAS